MEQTDKRVHIAAYTNEGQDLHLETSDPLAMRVHDLEAGMEIALKEIKKRMDATDEKLELFRGDVYTLQRDVMELKDRVKRLFEVTHALELNYANLENRLDQMELKLMDSGVIPNRQAFVEHNGTKPAFAVRRTSDLDLYND